MNAEKITDKIRKLLALSTSDNPNEAETALLMARRLMAQYKLTEKDVADAKSLELNHVTYTEATFSGLRNTWFPSLSVLIAENHCCCSISRHDVGSSVNNIVFVGLGDDPFIACQIFDYAVEHITKWGERKKKELKTDWIQSGIASEFSPRNLNDVAQRLTREAVTNYAIGFIKGLDKKYAEQNIQQSDEMALMVVMPAQVTEYAGGLNPSRLKFKKCSENGRIQREGYNAGYNFSPTPELNAKAQ